MNLHTYRHCFGGTLPLWISFPCRAPCVILSTCGRLAWRVEDVLHLPTNHFGPFEVRRRLYSPFVPTKQSESRFPRGTGGVSKGSFLPPVASVRLFLPPWFSQLNENVDMTLQSAEMTLHYLDAGTVGRVLRHMQSHLSARGSEKHGSTRRAGCLPVLPATRRREQVRVLHFDP